MGRLMKKLRSAAVGPTGAGRDGSSKGFFKGSSAVTGMPAGTAVTANPVPTSIPGPANTPMGGGKRNRPRKDKQ